MKKASGDATSIYLGKRIKVRRRSLGYTLDDLAAKTGISVQMCSKFERGTAQISAGALLKLSIAISADIDFLFPQNPNRLSDSQRKTHEDGFGISRFVNTGSFDNDVLYRKETADLIEVFYQLPTPELRKAIRAMVRTVASELSQEKVLLGPQ